ncbi:MAG TPA: hypothetical protein VMG09_09340 [Bacteroidota bacterium]|nr:hypothetical protein [Bacteroidota bacterium]
MESRLSQLTKRFAPTVITADTTGLSAGNRAALKELIAAAGVMDSLYLRQVWSGNQNLLAKLNADTSPAGQEMLRYFQINMGPWSKLDHDSAFVPGVPARPLGANYYPEDMSKEEFTTWVVGLAPADKEKATGFFTTIRRKPDHTLTMVPYSAEYKDLLDVAADHLRKAAALTDNGTLRDFLMKRATAFGTDDYYESDIAWMDLDSPIDVTIGPYETYMDGLFNYKAAFEAFIGIRDEAETAKLSSFAAHLQEIENSLPIDPKYRNPHLGAMAPIRVIDEVAIGGEAKSGVQTAAFNLPNDERIVQQRGSKRVMLRNVQEAKFNQILKPIAQIALDSMQRPLVAFDPFFTHILAHELMHGLGPHNIVVKGNATTVRQELKELYSSWEEAKADISGLFALQYLIDAGIVDKAMEQKMYVTYLAGIFRSIRFGITEAHGQGMALQFNYLLEHGAIEYNQGNGTFAIDFTKIGPATRDLTGIIMTVEAQGDYNAAKELLAKYAVVGPSLQSVLDKLAAIPVDIAPDFPLAK